MRQFVILAAASALLFSAAAYAAQPAGAPAMPPGNATADVVEARLFVDRLFAVYTKNGLPDIFENPGLTFDPELAQAISTLGAGMEESGELPGSFGADPVCNCQDYGDVSYRIDGVGIMGHRATATVSFSNFGQVDNRRIDLVRTPAGWRVFDLDGTFRSAVMADLAGPQP
jgi:hypothetical protein